MKHIGIIALATIIATPAVADIASTAYVGGVKTALEQDIDTKIKKQFETTDGNKAMITTDTGAVALSTVKTNMIADSNVTNSKVATGIGINKLDLPDDKCTSGSCMLIYNADEKTYAWEPVGRGSDLAPTTGVDGAGDNK